MLDQQKGDEQQRRYRIASRVALLLLLGSLGLGCLCLFSTPRYLSIPHSILGDYDLDCKWTGCWLLLVAYCAFCGHRYCAIRATNGSTRRMDSICFRFARILIVLGLAAALWILLGPRINRASSRKVEGGVSIRINTGQECAKHCRALVGPLSVRVRQVYNGSKRSNECRERLFRLNMSGCRAERITKESTCSLLNVEEVLL